MKHFLPSVIYLTILLSTFVVLKEIYRLNTHPNTTGWEQTNQFSEDNETLPTVVRYRVTLNHPHTGGVVYTTIVSTKEEAECIQDQYSQIHWKIWKAPDHSPWSTKRFSNYDSAQAFSPQNNTTDLMTEYVRPGEVSVVKL